MGVSDICISTASHMVLIPMVFRILDTRVSVQVWISCTTLFCSFFLNFNTTLNIFSSRMQNDFYKKCWLHFWTWLWLWSACVTLQHSHSSGWSLSLSNRAATYFTLHFSGILPGYGERKNFLQGRGKFLWFRILWMAVTGPYLNNTLGCILGVIEFRQFTATITWAIFGTRHKKMKVHSTSFQEVYNLEGAIKLL